MAILPVSTNYLVCGAVDLIARLLLVEETETVFLSLFQASVN